MHVDEKTRRDLELFHTRDGRPGVFSIVDRTRTAAGSAALRARFENPLADPQRIREVQSAVRFLIRERISFPLAPELVEEVHRYVESTWDVGSRRSGIGFRVESILVGLRYRDLLRHAREGIAATRSVRSVLEPALEDMLERDPPSEIRRLAKRMLALMDLLGTAFGLGRGSLWDVFGTDRVLRGNGGQELRELLAQLSELDAYCAMAEATVTFGLVFPELVESPGFVLQGDGLFHLFIEDPVRNPVELGEGRTLAFLTGPNMAGKTTYLKTVALAVYLAHVGMGVPARRLRMTPLEALFANLAPEEDLRAGLSYFMAEVSRVKAVAEALSRGTRALVIFDEVFRGTNVKDALDASEIVIRGFAGVASSGFIFSSHLVELGDGLRGLRTVRLLCFEGEIIAGRAHYGFKLKEGISNQRFGLHLLEEEGVRRILDALGP